VRNRNTLEQWRGLLEAATKENALKRIYVMGNSGWDRIVISSHRTEAAARAAIAKWNARYECVGDGCKRRGLFNPAAEELIEVNGCRMSRPLVRRAEGGAS
jgi:hypothetical protein